MASKQYKWRTTFNYQNEIDPANQLSYGVSPATQDIWQYVNVGTGGTGTWTYWYRDSNTMYGGHFVDAISTRVDYNVTQTWTATADSRNNLTISVTTTVNYIRRSDKRGNDQNTPGRSIAVYNQPGGTALISATDNLVAEEHSISGPVNLGTYTFTLAPGQNLTRNTLFIHNQTIGGSSYDDIWAGIQFQNPLPKDYRPGTSLDTNTSVWKSHNRTNGACHVRKNSTWQECRTLDGDIGGKGNPPLILHAANASSWYNQKKLGKE